MADFSNKVGLWSVEKVSEEQVSCFWETIAKIQRRCGPFAAMDRSLVATMRCMTWLGWCDVRWVKAAREVRRHCREMYDQLLQMNNALHRHRQPQPYCVMITQPQPHPKALPKVIPYILVDASAMATEPLMTIKPLLPRLRRDASSSASAIVFRQRSRSPPPPTSTSIARPPRPTSSSSKRLPVPAPKSSPHHLPPTSSCPHPHPHPHPRPPATVPPGSRRPPANSSSPLPRPPTTRVKPQNTKPIHRSI